MGRLGCLRYGTGASAWGVSMLPYRMNRNELRPHERHYGTPSSRPIVPGHRADPHVAGRSRRPVYTHCVLRGKVTFVNVGEPRQSPPSGRTSITLACLPPSTCRVKHGLSTDVTGRWRQNLTQVLLQPHRQLSAMYSASYEG